MALLEKVWSPAKSSADRERKALEDYVADRGIVLEGGIQPWDWRFFAEKVRQVKYDFDQGEFKVAIECSSAFIPPSMLHRVV